MMTLIALLGLLFAAAPPLKRATGHVRRTLVTCNDDFVSAGSNMLEVLRHHPDVIFIQEGKREHYADLRHPRTGARLFPMAEYGVLQDNSNDAIAGSVVIWRHDSWKKTGSGFTFAVRAVGLLARYIAWIRVVVSGGRKLFLFSAHRPPFRARRFWHVFDIALWARLARAIAVKRLILGGMDSNQHGGPPHLPRSLKWVAVGNSIDGFVLSQAIKVVSLNELPLGTSDHHPVVAVVDIPL